MHVVASVMCWIGRRKGRAGGNPSSVSKSMGDLPGSIETGGSPKNLTSVLMGRSLSGKKSAKPLPWKSIAAAMPDPRSAGIPRASSLPSVVEVDLPEFIKIDAHLCYHSRSSGKRFEVVVEMVSHTKSEVEIRFAQDPGVWKVIPFSLIASSASPLLGAWPNTKNDTKVGPTPQLESDGNDVLPRRRSCTSDGRESDTRSRSRSRSPR